MRTSILRLVQLSLKGGVATMIKNLSKNMQKEALIRMPSFLSSESGSRLPKQKEYFFYYFERLNSCHLVMTQLKLENKWEFTLLE